MWWIVGVTRTDGHFFFVSARQEEATLAFDFIAYKRPQRNKTRAIAAKDRSVRPDKISATRVGALIYLINKPSRLSVEWERVLDGGVCHMRKLWARSEAASLLCVCIKNYSVLYNSVFAHWLGEGQWGCQAGSFVCRGRGGIWGQMA